MKKYILMSALAALAFTATAQDFDTTPNLNIKNDNEQLKFTIGARFMADAALYHTDFTPLHSGGTISDARIRTSMQYGDNWYFYADFGFGGGKFAQKNIFLQYSTEDKNGATHAIKAGYYNDPAGSMSNQTSLGSYHFISRAGSANALGEGRELGITYKYSADNWFAYQGVFTESAYNRNINAGYNGFTAAGRWLFREVDEKGGGHVGASARFSHLGGGEEYTTKGSTVLKKTYSMAQTMETYVDEDESFVNADMPWANNVVSLGVEALIFGNNWFARGEYFHKIITKHRDSYSIFIASQDNIDGWGDIDAWEQANKLKTNHFNGGYVELGYKLFGPDYSYDKHNAVLNGLKGRALEVVGRVNYTGLNNLTDGEYYNVGRDQYYADGYMVDWPATGATSVGGGNLWSATIGLNYAFNKYTQVMLDYTYHHLDRDKLPYDKNFHQVQARVQFVF